MTSEKELRRIAHAEVTMLVRNPHHKEPLWEDHPELTEGEWGCVLELIDEWPIPDLPEQDEIAYPGPTKVWDVGDHHFVEHDPRDDKISLSQSFGEEVRLDPDDIPAAVSALLAAHHERNQE